VAASFSLQSCRDRAQPKKRSVSFTGDHRQLHKFAICPEATFFPNRVFPVSDFLAARTSIRVRRARRRIDIGAQQLLCDDCDDE
jgi:hypothetical protein